MYTVTFPANYAATSASEVTMEDITEPIDQLGAWQNLNVEGIPVLTVKSLDENFYALLNTYVAPLGPNTDSYYAGGCCADSFRRWNKNDNGSYSSFDVMNTVFDLFENSTDKDKNTGTPYAYANHVFDMVDIDDHAIALIAITYHEPGLDYAQVEAVVYYNTTSSTAIPTMDGQGFFSFYQNIGTLSTDSADSIYKIAVCSNKLSMSLLSCFVAFVWF